MGPPGMPIPMSADVGKLLASWGVKIDDAKVVGDPATARRVQYGGQRGRSAQVSQYLPWMEIGPTGINDKDPLGAGIKKLNMASAGAIVRIDGATTDVQPILFSSPTAGLIEAERIRFQPDPAAILRTFKPGSSRYVLAARITGDSKSAFPDGPPKPEEKPKTDDKPAAEKSLQEKREEKLN